MDLKELWANNKVDVDRPNWDEYFIMQAYLISLRSLDAQTQCGCVISTPEHTQIAAGYNSFIGGIDDSILPNLRPHKYDFMIHAEHNALLNCAKEGVSCKNCVAYITTPPCINCFQYLHQTGISEVVFHNGFAHMNNNEEYLQKFNVLCKLSKILVRQAYFNKDFSEKIRKIKECR
jgi:dCMP deaminase